MLQRPWQQNASGTHRPQGDLVDVNGVPIGPIQNLSINISSLAFLAPFILANEFMGCPWRPLTANVRTSRLAEVRPHHTYELMTMIAEQRGRVGQVVCGNNFAPWSRFRLVLGGDEALGFFCGAIDHVRNNPARYQSKANILKATLAPVMVDMRLHKDLERRSMDSNDTLYGPAFCARASASGASWFGYNFSFRDNSCDLKAAKDGLSDHKSVEALAYPTIRICQGSPGHGPNPIIEMRVIPGSLMIDGEPTLSTAPRPIPAHAFAKIQKLRLMLAA